jgi:hypothetical protein
LNLPDSLDALVSLDSLEPLSAGRCDRAQGEDHRQFDYPVNNSRAQAIGARDEARKAADKMNKAAAKARSAGTEAKKARAQAWMVGAEARKAGVNPRRARAEAWRASAEARRIMRGYLGIYEYGKQLILMRCCCLRQVRSSRASLFADYSGNYRFSHSLKL